MNCLNVLLFLIFLLFLLLIYLITKKKSKFIISPEKIFHTQNNFLTFNECDALINAAKNYLVRSLVNSVDKNNKYTSKQDISRTSSQAWLDKYKYSNIIDKVIKLVGKYTDYPISIKNFEDIQIAKYLPKQEYQYHYDICHPTQSHISQLKSCKSEFDIIKSVRYVTVIAYLNDNYTEGETKFTKLNIKIKPEKGKALLFFNCNLQKDSNVTGLCDIIDNSEHAGLPVKNGEKWIANFWIRLKTYKK